MIYKPRHLLIDSTGLQSSASPTMVKGCKIVAFVIFESSVEEAEELKKEISTHVRKVLGPVAYPDKVYFVKDVPKTLVRQDHAPRHQG